MTWRTRAGAVLLFFAWGFFMHASGLVLHELGGHALAGRVLACGVSGWQLTFFGHGQVTYAPCTAWTEARVLVADWAGLALTITTGLVAASFARSPRLAPLPRLLVALVAFFFLVGQLGYAASGGFHDLYDPGRTARILGAHGAHVVAWLVPLVAYAAAAAYGARAVVDAFRAHFGTATRLATLLGMATTLGLGGVLYGLAYRIEWQLRADLPMKGVATAAERVAVQKGVAPPFPFGHLLTAIAVAAVAWALLRRPRDVGGGPVTIPRRTAARVAALAGGTFLVVAALMRAG